MVRTNNSEIMKKLILTACAVLVALFSATAQDVNQATDLYNNGAAALASEDNAGALSYFQQALALAKECGESGQEIVDNCSSVIPALFVRVAKGFIKTGDFDKAISTLKEAVTVSAELGDDAKSQEAENLIPQVFVQKGNAAIKKGDYNTAVSALNSALEVAPNNGNAALLLGQAYDKVGEADKAVEAYTLAASLGKEKAANKQLSTMFLKKASAKLKAKDFAGAVADAQTSNNYVENAQAFYVAGVASQSIEKVADAIAFFEKYLELAPTANNANDVRTVVEGLKKAAAAQK